MSALPCPVVDPFAAADQAYATITEFLRSEEAWQVKHSELERQLEGMGRELMRKLLQAHLNMRLLNRTSRGLSLTEIGKDYLNGCREIIGKLDELESNLMRASRDRSGTRRIAAPMTFVTSGLGALLASYRTLHPRIDFDVTTFDTHVDMVEGGYDVCFSDDRQLASATLVSRRLTSIDEMVVASPDVPAAARHAAEILEPLGLGWVRVVSCGP